MATDVITTHLNANFIGVASMVAGRKPYPGAPLVLPGGTQETVRNFLSIHDLGITPLKDLDQPQISRLVLMDIQEPERLGPLAAAVLNLSVELDLLRFVHSGLKRTSRLGAMLKSVEETLSWYRYRPSLTLPASGPRDAAWKHALHQIARLKLRTHHFHAGFRFTTMLESARSTDIAFSTHEKERVVWKSDSSG